MFEIIMNSYGINENLAQETFSKRYKYLNQEGIQFPTFNWFDGGIYGRQLRMRVYSSVAAPMAVAKEEGVIQLEKPVKYVSSNVEILDAHTVEVMPIEAEDEYAYIIY